ncbi:TonB-dependent receptor [Novosphingobium sp. SG707]|uniref:TonB-dependent receptor n=1 Tax=Novosphingobium sp. SG707 TaxID=2586996 RepID=UPI00144724BA|nr:TonB-dependent receptor [Novosphingobium sp. SG707]NKJ00939.1 iron complex outermembrane receptor protein [Novosphingobium sp. SG707]
MAHLPLRAAVLCGAAFIALGSSPVLAQDSHPKSPAAADPQSSGTIADIVVTAQKRAESVQNTPLAVSAIGGAALAQRGATDLTSIASAVPGLNVSEQVGQARLTLRGIGVDNISTGAESSVAFNQDGVFFSRSAAALASFYDVERVEVLRGPQGTLYGRNATGGSVNIITNRPTFSTKAGTSLTYGNYDTINTEAYYSTGLTDTVAVRFAGQIQNHAGYGKNVLTDTDIDDKHSQAVRGQLLFEPNTRLTILLGADYYHQNDRSNTYHYFGAAGFTATGTPITPTGLLLGGVDPGPRNVASVRDPANNAQFWGARAVISFKLTDHLSLRSLSAYRSSHYLVNSDLNPIGVNLFPIDFGETSNEYSQEFQLNLDTSRNKLVVGAFYMHEDIDGFIQGPFNLRTLGGPSSFVQGFYSGGHLKTDAAAIFAQDSFSITHKLRLTLGGRYSWERKGVADQSDFDFADAYVPGAPVTVPVHVASKTFGSFTPKIGLDYNIAEKVMAYASYSKGFKAGTFNLGSASPALNPEKVNAYELGLKSTLLDGHLRANLSGFYYDYSDLQVGKVQGQLLVLENAAAAQIYGLESEFTLKPVRDLTIGLNASWLHGRFKRYVTADQARPGGDGHTLDENGVPAFNLAGNTLPQSPNYTIDLSAEYSVHLPNGSLTLRGESYWSDQVYFSAFNLQPMSQPAYNQQNAYLTYRLKSGLRLTGFVRNIGNKTIRASGQVASALLGSPILGFVKPPRTYGLTVAFDY